MAGEEIGVQVGEHDVRDPQVVLAGEGQVLLDVALRIDDDRHAGGLVADDVGGVRETVQVELLEDHRCVSEPVNAATAAAASRRSRCPRAR